VGDDAFGWNIIAILKAASPNLDVGMVPVRGEVSSYSVVINPPGIDRSFLHCPGANDSFGAEDVPDALLEGAALLHFGYPPLMTRIREDGGAECARLFRRARAAGLTVTLDMARPDPASPGGRTDWRAWLARVLPETDVFLPSIDELLFMLDRPRFETLEAQSGGMPDGLYDPGLVAQLAGEILDMGAAAAVIKLGAAGLYLRTTPDPARLSRAGAAFPRDARWVGRELYAPCFSVEVAGTTGSGDCTIAGFLAALMRGRTPGESVEFAVAAGACCVEAPDATGGVRGWDETRARIAAGWQRRDPAPGFAGWRDIGGLRVGPCDGGDRGDE
ncbi:MAG: PfkB family carbohydrate kinase, partial [Planctomycetota bacterium]|nr:PfkB family carbohydrate kinase [Planctomycetota bacterium]